MKQVRIRPGERHDHTASDRDLDPEDHVDGAEVEIT